MTRNTVRTASKTTVLRPALALDHPAPGLVTDNGTPPAGLATHSYGSCSLLRRLWQFVGVGVPALVGLAGAVLVAASPEGPGVAVRLVAPGPGDDGAAELSEQLRGR